MKTLHTFCAAILSGMFAVTVAVGITTPAMASTNISAIHASSSCLGADVYGKYDGVTNNPTWETEWQTNPGNCQQQSAAKCEKPGTTQFVWVMGGWIYATYLYSGVNCPGSYAVFRQGNINYRTGPGAPIGYQVLYRR